MVIDYSLTTLRILIKYQIKVSGNAGCLTLKSFTEFTDSGLLLKMEVVNDKCWRGCGEKGTLVHSYRECRVVKSL